MHLQEQELSVILQAEVDYMKTQSSGALHTFWCTLR